MPAIQWSRNSYIFLNDWPQKLKILTKEYWEEGESKEKHWQKYWEVTNCEENTHKIRGMRELNLYQRYEIYVGIDCEDQRYQTNSTKKR